MKNGGSGRYEPGVPGAAVRRRFSREEVMFLIAIPLGWAILLLFHPGGECKDVYGDLHD